MKKILCFGICMILLVAVAGCTNAEAPDTTAETVHSDEPQPLMPEIESTDIGGLMLDKTAFGKPVSECGLPQENLFIEDEKMQGYDYVSLCGIDGSLSVYLENGIISSFVFGSSPYDDKAEYSEAFNNANKLIAELCGQPLTEPVYNGEQSENDEIDRVFDGSGIMSVGYSAGNVVVTVRSCGVNGAATIVVESAPQS